MKMTRRILSWVLAISLVITCGITGLVLPVGAESAEAVDLFNGMGAFDNEDLTAYASTALSDITGNSNAKAYATIVDDPDGSGDNKVLQIGKFVDEDGDGVNDGAYTHTSYPKWKKLYNAETGTYNKPLEAGKCYTLKLDVYGDGIGMYFQGKYKVLSYVADASVGTTNGWFQLGNGAEEWKTYTFVFYAAEDIAEAYHPDWWSWGMSWSKHKSDSCQPGNGYTYIDNIQLYETQATSIAIDSEDIVLEPGDVTEALAVTVAPERSTAADVVWSSDAEGVAKVDAATGVITAVGYGTATITATAGTLTDEIKVTVQEDKTEVKAPISGFKYDSNYSGTDYTWAKNDPMPVTDDYVTLPTTATLKSDYHIRTPYLQKFDQGEWLAVSFKVRVSQAAAGDTGSVNMYLKFQGMATGYTYDNVTVRASANEWVECTVFAHAVTNKTAPYIQISITQDTTTTKKGIDIKDVRSYKPDPEDMNLFGDGSFENDAVSNTVGAYAAKGEIVTDPKDDNNKVFKWATASNGTYVIPGPQIDYIEEGNSDASNRVFDKVKPNTMYKLTFRMLGKMHVAVGASKYASILQTIGSPTTTSTEWKTVTVYYLASSLGDDGYSFYLRNETADTYIDDLAIYEVGNATGFEISADTEMIIGESQTLSYTTIPKHAYPGTVTLSLADDATGLSLSSSKLTAKAVTGVTVTGGDVIATSTLTDADGNPVSSSVNIKVDYPKVILDEDFESELPELLTGKGGGTVSLTDVESYSGEQAVLQAAPAGKQNCWYFYKASYAFKPNSVYRFTAKVKGAEAGKTIKTISINKANINDVTFTQQAYVLDDKWTTYTAWIKTGAAPAMTNANYGFGLLANSSTVEATSFYVDDMKIELMDANDERFVAGSFDTVDVIWNTNSYMSFEAGAGRDGSYALAFTPNAVRTAEVIENIPYLEPYSMYELTYWTKASDDYAATTQIYWGHGMVTVPVYNATLKTTTEWTENKLTFFTNAKTNLAGNSFHFDVKTAGAGTIYVDDVSLKRVDTNFVNVVSGNASAPLSISVDGGKTYSQNYFVKDVPAGTVVKVKTWHASDFILSPGSYTFTNGDGVTKILNKDILNGYTADNFGTGTGEVFEFIMPEKGGQVYGNSLKKTDQSFLMDTVATSLRYTDEEDTYDGIRFLTRLALKTKFDPTTEGLTVTYGGVEYTVLEFGSLLKRYEESEGVEVELTLDNAKWTSPAYVKGSETLSTMKVLDYTTNNSSSATNYLDFTSVMKKGEKVAQEDFEARTYTARGYMILDVDADGVYNADVDQVIYSTNQVSDSVDSVQARL